MDVGAVLIQLKSNSQTDIATWQRGLQSHQRDAIATLQAEGVSIESWFHVVINEQDYLIAYMRAQDIQRAQQIAKTSPFFIDQIHQAFKQNWVHIYPATLLIDLENNEHPRNPAPK